jgi:hypothetical protein
MSHYLRLVVPVFSFLSVWLFGDVQTSLLCRGAAVVVLLIAQLVSKFLFSWQIRADDNLLMPTKRFCGWVRFGRVKKVNAVLRFLCLCMLYISFFAPESSFLETDQ